MFSVWPPAYTLKKNKLSKHVRFKTSLKGLEVVVPLRFNIKHLPDLIDKNRAWIEKQFKKMQRCSELHQADLLPEQVSFPALNQTWNINYVATDSPRLNLIKRPHQFDVAIMGNVNDKAACKRLLNKWVKKEAQIFLPDRLTQLSRLTNLEFTKVKIREQRRRWGSCSQDKIINLNFKLLFLSAELIDHVLLHELCHTQHFDHSLKFWNLLASLDDNWKANDKAIKRDESLLPIWTRVE